MVYSAVAPSSSCKALNAASPMARSKTAAATVIVCRRCLVSERLGEPRQMRITSSRLEMAINCPSSTCPRRLASRNRKRVRRRITSPRCSRNSRIISISDKKRGRPSTRASKPMLIVSWSCEYW